MRKERWQGRAVYLFSTVTSRGRDKDAPPKPWSSIHPSTAHARDLIQASRLSPKPRGGERASTEGRVMSAEADLERIKQRREWRNR